jgi:hypothetical protein
MQCKSPSPYTQCIRPCRKRAAQTPRFEVVPSRPLGGWINSRNVRMIRHAVRFAHHAPLVSACVFHQKWTKIDHLGNAATDANVNGNRKGTIDSSKPCLVELLRQSRYTVEMLEYLALSKNPRGQQLTCSKSISTSRRGVSTSCIHVRPLAASSTGNTSCAYSSMERLPSHRSSATVGTAGSKSGPKYGAPFSPRVYSKAARCSR